MSKSKKTVVITGCSTGIGEETAKLFAKKGWIVFAGVRKQADAERLQNLDVNIKPLIIDVTNPEQLQKAFSEVQTAVGADGLDALVNNAGSSFMGPTEFMDMKDIQKQFDVNVFGVIRVTQAALPLLRIGKPGRIVNVSSIAPEMVAPFGGMYSATKGALDCVGEGLRREVAEWGIKVSTLKPGPVRTNFASTAVTQAKQVQEAFPDGSKGHELYGKTIDRLPELFEKIEKGRMAPPSAASNVIFKAITCRNPKNFYWDTWGTWFLAGMLGWMPTWAADSAIASLFK